MLSVEPPEHTRYRKLVSSVFTTRAVAALRDRVQDTANTLLDDLGDEPGVVDVVERYCSQLPVTVIGDILGVPDDARPRILEFGELGAPSLDIGLTWPQYRQVYRGIEGFNNWLSDHLHELRRNPGDDLMSQIIRGQRRRGSPQPRGAARHRGPGAGRRLRDHGQPAGQRNSDAARAPRAPRDAGRAARTVAERRRGDPAAGFAGAAERAHRQQGHRGRGHLVRRDEGVILYLAGANRDPKVFDDPHRFDIERDNAGKHLSFSGGRHFCLGAALARAEGEVGLRTFFERYPDARLAGDGSRRDTRVLRGWSSLPIALGKARTAVRS